MLARLLYHECGSRLSPSHTVKNGKRYRCYLSRDLVAGVAAKDVAEGLRIPAHEIETLGINALERLLLNSSRLFDILGLDRSSPSRTQKALAQARRTAALLRKRSGSDVVAVVRKIVDPVTMTEDEIHVVASAMGLKNTLDVNPGPITDVTGGNDVTKCSIKIPARLKRCGGASRLVVPVDDNANIGEPDPALLKLLSRAQCWFNAIAIGKSQSAAEIARVENLTQSYVTRVIRLAFLAPDITEAILNGCRPLELNAERLVRRSRLPLAWDEQRRLLGYQQLTRPRNPLRIR